MSEMTYKPKLLCVPHDGSRSPEYLKFKRTFRAGCIAETALRSVEAFSKSVLEWWRKHSDDAISVWTDAAKNLTC